MSSVRTELRRSLVLLPPAPSPPTYAALKAAYNSPLSFILRELSRSPQRSHGPIILDIALPCDHLHRQRDLPRSTSYAATQSLVAGLYKLICIIAAKDAIDTEDSEGFDARILLLAYPRDGRVPLDTDSSSEDDAYGPVVDLRTLASCPRAWDTVYSVQSEEGEQLLRNFNSLDPRARKVSRVRGGIVHVSSQEDNNYPVNQIGDVKEHLSTAVGGTFDHLHIGHKLLLTMSAYAVDSGHVTDQGTEKCLTVGITGDELLKKKKYAEFLESWDARQQAAHDFLSSILYFGQANNEGIHVEEKKEPGPNGHAVHVTYPSNLVIKYVEIWDPFGPTITEESISALVISAETRSGGKAVNDRRKEQGWAPLEVFEVDVLDAEEEGVVDETFQNKLSSTEIRRQRSERARSKN